jgi:hypothetical protein
MISHGLVKLIETHADDLTRLWLEDVRKSPATPGYHSLPEETLRSRAFDVYARLGHWVGGDEHRAELEKTYKELGRQRFLDGLPLSEVVAALALTKYRLWEHVRDRGLLDSAVHLYQALDLYNRVVVFFDQATHFAIIGYEQASRTGR